MEDYLTSLFEDQPCPTEIGFGPEVDEDTFIKLLEMSPSQQWAFCEENHITPDY
jgi:hypothetical protein